MKRPGYYVNGKHYFGLDKRSQALAKQQFLEKEYGRNVNLEKVDYDFMELEQALAVCAA